MTDSTQATLVTDPDAMTDDGDAVDSDDTIDDDGLLAKVRASNHPAVRCGYCHEVALKGYETSAHDRRYCPKCRTVRAEDQRDLPLSEWWEH
jgi:phage FluMu protein Com